MESLDALKALAALAQHTRLEAFRLLVRNEPAGLPAGELALMLDVPPSTLSTHLAALVQAGLARSERNSRVICYRADVATLRALLVFLAKDCCAGNADLCAPLIAELTC